MKQSFEETPVVQRHRKHIRLVFIDEIEDAVLYITANQCMVSDAFVLQQFFPIVDN